MKAVKWLYMLSLICLGLLLAGCGGGTAGEPLAVTTAQAGSMIELAVGQELQVSLPANPSTGYSWEVAPDSTAVLVQEGEPEFASDSQLLGAGGLETLRLTAQKAGSGTLRLIYHRPWEEGVEPAEVFTLEVVIR